MATYDRDRLKVLRARFGNAGFEPARFADVSEIGPAPIGGRRSPAVNKRRMADILAGKVKAPNRRKA